MNLSIIAITFGLIFVAELPDKTMIATIVLSSRHRPLPGVDRGRRGHGRQLGRGRPAPAASSSCSPTGPSRRWWPRSSRPASLYLLLSHEESAETEEGEEEADQADRAAASWPSAPSASSSWPSSGT